MPGANCWFCTNPHLRDWRAAYRAPSTRTGSAVAALIVLTETFYLRPAILTGTEVLRGSDYGQLHIHRIRFAKRSAHPLPRICRAFHCVRGGNRDGIHGWPQPVELADNHPFTGYPKLYLLPGTLLRSPARLLYLSTVCAAVALGAGVDAIRPRQAVLRNALLAVALSAHFLDLWGFAHRFIQVNPRDEGPPKFQTAGSRRSGCIGWFRTTIGMTT